MDDGAASAVDFVTSEIEAWCFFHLGADAVVTTRSSGEGLDVSLAHGRIHPFEIRLEFRELERFARDPGSLEHMLLAELAKHRKSE